VSSAAAVRVIAERLQSGEVPFWVHPEWEVRFPWLLQGTTGAGESASFDMGLGGAQEVGTVLARWSALRRVAGCPSIVFSRQIHGVELWVHRDPLPPGLLIMEGRDAHLTSLPGLALTVSVADCAPVFLVDARRRAIGLVHAGWKGVAGGILEAAVRAMRAAYHSSTEDLRVHLGPSICESCYEVGPEVHAAVWPARDVPVGAACIDLRLALVARAEALGIPLTQLTRSGHCTRCAAGSDQPSRPFFSHRAGEPGRQLGVLAIRPD
jgi:polyphenol oxidase